MKRLMLSEVRKRFSLRNLELLGEYETSHKPVLCRCRICDFKYKLSLHHADIGRKCPKCNNLARVKGDIEYAKSIFELRGLDYLDPNYVNCDALAKCKCKKCGFEYRQSLTNVRAGYGCKRCATKLTAEKLRFSIDEVRTACQQFGFELLSKTYANCFTKLELKCYQGHVFQKSLANIKHYQGCPSCSDLTSERVCRILMEKLLGKASSKVRPEWLRYKNGRNLELDIFFEELGLAIEHNGGQHYRFVRKFHQTKLAFLEQLDRDEFKRVKCHEQGVKLIIVKELFVHTKLDKLPEFIRQECAKLGIYLDTLQIDMNDILRQARRA